MMWWIDSGWMSGAQQSGSITPLISRTEEIKYNKKFMSQDKGRVTSHHQMQNSLDLEKLL